MAKFFHLQKSKRFSYKPRYYNEMDEQRKERETKVLQDLDDEKLGKPRVTKEDMDSYLKIARRTQKKSSLTLFVILILLIAIFYFMFVK